MGLWYSGVFSMVPPDRSGLYIDSIWLNFSDKFSGSMSEGCGAIGCTDEI